MCVYEPPKGKIAKLTEFLKTVITRNDFKEREIWTLGDFNTDWLERDNQDTVKLLSFCKNSGLVQSIDEINRPNMKGGSCIDLIFSNCKFVKRSGILDDVISDHYGIYSIRKKSREAKEMCWKKL